MSSSNQEMFSGRLGFVLAAIGSAIGLGNIWRFAYVAGDNGGAVFLLAYALCVLLIGLPVLLAEFVLGSRARGDVLLAFKHAKASPAWQGAGVLAALVAFLILSYYSVIAGWALRYFAAYVNGTLPALPREALPEAFDQLVADPVASILWHALFMALTTAVVIAGIARGIERVCRILMPVLAVMVLLLAGFALSLPGAERGLAFLFAPDWSALGKPGLYLAALGQAFFSLGVAMGVMVTYAGHLRSREQLASAAVAVAVADTLFAVAAGMAIFPIVFAYGMQPNFGPALAFVTLPQIFSAMPGGAWLGGAFFFLLSAAALTSAVSLLAVPVAVAARMGWKRTTAAVVIGLGALLAGVPSALGGGWWREVRLAGRPILDAVDFLAADILLPVVGITVVVYTGWILPRAEVLAGSGLSPWLARAWLASVRYLAPIAMTLVLLTLWV